MAQSSMQPIDWIPYVFDGERKRVVDDISDDEWDYVSSRTYKFNSATTAAWPVQEEALFLKRQGIENYSLYNMEVIKSVGDSYEILEDVLYTDHIGTLCIFGYSEDAVGGNLLIKGETVVSTKEVGERWFMVYIPVDYHYAWTTLERGTRYTIKFAVRSEISF